MSTHKKKLDWCLARKTRMKVIQPNNKLSEEHINKAKHNLRAADYNIKGGFSDWGVSQSYYAMYHSVLASLFKIGIQARAHYCAIAAFKKFYVERGKVKPEYINYIKKAKQLGFQGKLCIHPNQIEPCHAIFSPSKEEMLYAERVVQAFEEAEAQGIAAIQLDGKFIDYAVVERSRKILKLAT